MPEPGRQAAHRFKSEKYLERIHILRTLVNYGPLHASDLADRANTECDDDVFDDLPEISRRGIGQKLQAMEGEGLVAGSFLGVGLPKQWKIVEGGRRALATFEQNRQLTAQALGDVSPDIERRIRSHTERLMKLTLDFEDRGDALGEAWRNLNDALNERFAAEYGGKQCR